MTRIGIFGGTFNPPHVGHLIVAESVRDQLRFDTILFIPSASPPNKRDSTLAPADDRFRMTHLAVQGNPAFVVSDIEVRRPGYSYTIDTLRALATTYQQASLSLILGADNWLEFATWRAPREIAELADLVVMTRPGFAIEQNARNEFARRARFANVPSIGISGTDIRRRTKLGRSIRYLVPPAVEDFIRTSGLYRD